MGIQTALVVDDSRSARYILQHLLEQRHIHVDQVDSAQLALSYLSEFRPDVVFMDDTMPGMGGHEAVERLASDPRTRSIPIVMYTARDYAEVAPALRRGVVGVLSKPFTPDDVNALLEKLERSGGTREQLQPPKVLRLVRAAEPAVSGVAENRVAHSTAAAPQTDKAAPGIRTDVQAADALRAEMSAAVKAEVRLAVDQWLGEILEDRVKEQLGSQHAAWRRVLNEQRAELDRLRAHLLEQRIPRLLSLMEQRLELHIDLKNKTLAEQIGNAGLGPLQRTQVASMARTEAIQAAHRPARQAARQVAAELMRSDISAMNLRFERLRQRLNFVMGFGVALLLATASLAYLFGTLR